MDIRSFFGKKGGSSVTKKSNKKQPKASKQVTSSTATPVCKQQKTKNSSSLASSSKSSKSKAVKRRRHIDSEEEDDDSDATTDELVSDIKEELAKEKVPSKKRKIVEDDNDSDSETTNEEIIDISSKPKKQFEKTNSKSSRKHEKPKSVDLEVNPEDFFQGNVSSKKKKVPDSKKPKKVIELLPSSPSSSETENEFQNDDETENVKVTSKGNNRKSSPSPVISKRRATNNKRKVVQHDDDSDSDEDDDDDDYRMEEDPPQSEQESFDSCDEDEEFTSSKTKRRASPVKSSTNKPKQTTTPARKATSRRKVTTSPTPKKKGKTAPTMPSDPLTTPYDINKASSGCLEGLTFVFTGVLSNLNREDAEDAIKILGGRVTKAVSGKTDYLVCGEELEDGRNVEEGSKYRKAKDLGEPVCRVVMGEEWFHGLVNMLDERFKKENGLDGVVVEKKKETPSSSAVKNPYAKSRPANPYAKKTTGRAANPYANASSSVAVKLETHDLPTVTTNNKGKSQVDANALWADKFAPKSSRQILGNAENIRKLTTWLTRWEDTFNNTRAQGKTFSAPGGPWKAALLSGPPGIGKTTTATLVASESGRDVLELNASDVRSKKGLSEGLGDVTGSRVLNFGTAGGRGKKKQERKRCIIMDEVDGMGAGDRSGMAELIKMIKGSKVPIICICNDRQSQKIRSLVPYCLDLRYRRPVKTVIARRAVEVGATEGMRVELNAAEAIAESCGNDIRQVLNVLQMWSNKKGTSSSEMTYRDVKERQHHINKDEMLRVSMFDATKMIVEGCRGVSGSGDAKAANASLFKRSDAYFMDYSLMGLNVHQNYMKVLVPQFQETKRSGDIDAEQNALERMSQATETMSDFAMAEDKVRSDQNWQLLPLCAILAVKTGHHVGGERGGFLPGFPEFAGWLGKNSTRGKMSRLLEELSHHMNYKVSGDARELRLQYMPVLRRYFLALISDRDGSGVQDLIEAMDEYGLDRDDVFENIDQFTLDTKTEKFANLDSKAKAAFTRAYNKGVHKSQALVDEQGVTKTRKKQPAAATTEGEDLDAIDDDKKEVTDEEEDGDDELDAEAVKALFKKKGRGKKAAPKTKKTKTSVGKANGGGKSRKRK